MISYLAVAQATEFGIRLALGAQPGVVFRYIIADALRTAMPGIVVGITVAWAAGRLIKNTGTLCTGSASIAH